MNRAAIFIPVICAVLAGVCWAMAVVWTGWLPPAPDESLPEQHFLAQAGPVVGLVIAGLGFLAAIPVSLGVVFLLALRHRRAAG